MQFGSLEEFQEEFKDINQEEQISRLHKMLAPHLLRSINLDLTLVCCWLHLISVIDHFVSSLFILDIAVTFEMLNVVKKVLDLLLVYRHCKF